MNVHSFGPYQLMKRIATGGMAEVWLARQTGIEGFQRELVVKRILPHLADDPEFVQMFLNEAKIAARFNHPNIAQIYDLGEANGTYFIAMEYVHGDDLGRVMRKAWSTGQWIARPLSLRIVANVCEGLYYAHSRSDEMGRALKVVHRDISPQNILISFDGSVKVVDFGIAKAADQASLTKSGAIKGKFAYMAPEQAAGKALDHRTDIFSLGLVLYELLTGVRPLKRESELATLQAALECAIQPPSVVADVPPELDPVVMKALAKSADDRYRDARQLQVALEDLLLSQQWVASSVQVSELMNTLFAERLEEESRLGRPDPLSDDSASGVPMLDPEPSHSTGARTGSSVSGRWESPPGESGRQRPSRTRAASGRRGSSDSHNMVKDTRAFVPPDSVPDWEAPPSAEIPGRRRSQEAPRRATREISGLSPTNLRQVGEGVRRGTIRSVVVEDDVPSQSSEVTGPPDASEPPRPAPRLSGIRRAKEEEEPTVHQDEEPSAPPRHLSGALRKELSPSEVSDGSQSSPLAPLRASSLPAVPKASRVPPAALIAVAAAGVALLLWWGLRRGEGENPAVLLSVTSNLAAQVSVRHGPGCGSAEPVSALGLAPLQRVAGAHVKDTVILESPEQGAHYEKQIQALREGQVERIDHFFRLGKVRLRLKPAGLTGIQVSRSGAASQGWDPQMPFELVEGKHLIELNGDALRAPVQLEVQVRPNALQLKEVDLSRDLQ